MPRWPTDSSRSPIRTLPSAASAAAAACRLWGVVERRDVSQFVKFAAVGGSGYVLNLLLFAAFAAAGIDALAAASLSFLAAACSNYALNRAWTFRAERDSIVRQGVRFLAVSLLALGTNVFALHLLLVGSAPRFGAQAVAILVSVPMNFFGNKLWAFRCLQPATAQLSTTDHR